VPLGNVFQWLHAPRAAVTPQQQKKVALDTAKGMLYLHTRNPPIIHRYRFPLRSSSFFFALLRSSSLFLVVIVMCACALVIGTSSR
jgi:hypothetical protein